MTRLNSFFGIEKRYDELSSAWCATTAAKRSMIRARAVFKS